MQHRPQTRSTRRPPGRPRPDRNAWVSSTYMGGEGARERLAKLIDEGVMVGGEMVKLESFTREYDQSFEMPTDRALGLSALTERAKIVREGGETFLQVGLQAIEELKLIEDPRSFIGEQPEE